MGYYVSIVESTAKIPANNLEKAYKAMCALNTTHDHVKRGGSWSGGKQTKRYFSWMDENYPETCSDANEILNQLGFETEYDDNGDLLIVDYDNKAGQEDLFLKAIDHLAVGEITWKGEEGETWTTEFNVLEGTLIKGELPAPREPGATMSTIYLTHD